MKITSNPSYVLATLLTACNAAPQKYGLPQPEGLAVLAKQSGLLYFGTAVDNPAFSNALYLSIAYNPKEFNQVTPANGQKWMYTEPQQNVFNYTLGDQVVDPALKIGDYVRCHNLLWHNQLPYWLTSRNWTSTELTAILENHIKNVVTHYKGKCYAWDVVNEALNDDGTYRSDIWLDTIGPSYIGLAFQLARKYDNKVKLYYNDYNIENLNNKSMSAQNIVKELKSQKIDIDGVGLQSHFIAGESPSYADQVANMKAFTALGVEVAITELDVRITLPDSTAKMQQQATDYANAVKACKDVKGCVGVTVWDFYDPYSWVPSTFPGQGDADLWTANFTKKPAYFSIAQVLGW